jgi:hypothetical protein
MSGPLLPAELRPPDDRRRGRRPDVRSQPWGDVDEHDRRENELSLQHGWRLLSAYTLSTGVKFWILTEADRSVTTFLLPDEY